MKIKHRKVKLRPLLLTAFLFCFVMGTIVYGAVAKRSDRVTNSMNMGVVKGEIEEEFVPNKPLALGVPYEKKVTIENKGSMNLFVRVMIFPQITSKDQVAMPANIGEEVKIDLQNKWVDGGDGYFYYIDKLLPKNKTQPLFTEVALDQKLGSDYQQSILHIQIKSETVTSVESHYRSAWWNKKQDEIPVEKPYKKIDDGLQPLIDKR